MNRSKEEASRRPLDAVITTVCIVMGLYHLVSTQYLFVDPIQHQNLHLGFSFVLIFFPFLKKEKRARLFAILLLLLALISIVYVHIYHEALKLRLGFPTHADVVIGLLLILLALEATRRAWGILLPALAALAFVYSLTADKLPEPFHGMDFPLDRVVYNLSTGLTGMYGLVLSISANFIFLFVLFGALLQASGATGFFTEIGKLVGRRLQGGPAFAAVVTSALVGMVTGSVAANIATTGAFTIPMMKRIGYKPHQAGAIEATASTGGQMMPPIMGAAAFLMAGFIGVPYQDIMVAAAIPAILYFFTTGVYAQLNAMKLKLGPEPQPVDRRELLLGAPLFFVPLGFLIYLLVAGFTAMFSIFWATVSLIGASLTVNLYRFGRGESDLPFSMWARKLVANWVRGFEQGAVAGAQVAVSCSVIGIVIYVIDMTGLGIKLPIAVEVVSGGYLPAALFLTMIVSLILGCGMPTGSVYIFVAMVCAPVLTRMGLELMAAHFFVFYFGCISFVTPPIGIGALVAARLAGASFFKTSVESVKSAIAGFIVPFLFIFSPPLLLRSGGLTGIVRESVLAMLLLVSVQALICNHYLVKLNTLQRFMTLGVAVLMMAYFVFQHNREFFILGVILLLTLTVWQMSQRRRRSP